MNPGKMEKEPESLAVQMKSDYASSEVYSTAGSEAPPAYKMRQANSVKIAKIIAAAIIFSTFMLGCFILATTYMQSHAVCDQIKSLEDALDKEMMLEIMSQQSDLPKPAALQDDDNVVEDTDKKTSKAETNNAEDTNNDNDSTETNEINDSHRFQLKFPMDIDLNQLAANFMRSTEKSKMNCVVEKRKAEELLNPFDILAEPRKTKVTGERLAIICESNVEPIENDDDKQEIHIRQFIVPFSQGSQQQVPIPYGAMPNINLPGPITHMPLRMVSDQMPPSQMIPHPIMSRLFLHAQQRPQPFNQQPFNQQPFNQQPFNQQPIPQQIMQAPPVQQPQVRVFQPIRNEVQSPPQVRIQLHRIAVPNPEQQSMEANENQSDQMQVQQVPLAVALAKAGITPEDLNNIRKIAEVKFQQEMNRFMESENEDNQNDTSESSDEPVETNQESQSSNEEGNLNILPIGRLGFARSLLKPVNIPVQMMPQEATENNEKLEQN